MNLRIRHLIFVSLIISLITCNAFADIGTVIVAKGEAYAIDTENTLRELYRRSSINEGDTLITGENSEIQIRFTDNAILALQSNSKLKITEYHASANHEEEQVLMELLSGGFRTITGSFGKKNKEAYKIRTPNASIGVRGTNYEAVLSNNSLYVGVYRGGVRLQNQTGSINLGLDSAFNFAEVANQNSRFKGLLSAPPELSIPLTPALNTKPAPNKANDEPTANISEDDDALLITNLFREDQLTEELNQAPSATLQDTSLARIDPTNSSETAIESIAKENNLGALQDVRLTQDQIRELQNGAPTGFVVVNQKQMGDQVAKYQLQIPFDGITSLSNTLSFDIKVGEKTYNIILPASYSAATPSTFATDLNSQIQAQAGVIDGTNIVPNIIVEASSGVLVFKGYGDGESFSIALTNFSSISATELTDFAMDIGLCDNINNYCQNNYDLGPPTTGPHQPAVHFGYMVQSKEGPVFVNYESESVTVLNGQYETADNVFKGNANAPLTQFIDVDTAGDGSNLIQWGYWQTSAASPAELLKDPKDASQVERIADPYFYAVAPPAKAAERVGEKTLNTTVAWHGTSSTANGIQSDDNTNSDTILTATLAVNFANAEAAGTLNFSNTTENWQWDLNYYGHIEGAQFFSQYGYGALNNGNTQIEAIGHVDGLFTSANNGLGFVGGFGLQTTDGEDSAQGVFIIKQ